MRYARLGLAALAVAAALSAASPALASIAVCTATDSDGRWYTVKQTGVFDWQARNLAESLATGSCKGSSKHPETCRVSCTITQSQPPPQPVVPTPVLPNKPGGRI